MCVQRRHKSACAFAQSDQCPRCPHSFFFFFASLAIQNALNEEYDQTVWGAHVRIYYFYVAAQRIASTNILKAKSNISAYILSFTDFCCGKFKNCLMMLKNCHLYTWYTFVELFLSYKLLKWPLSKQKGSKSKVGILIQFWKVTVHLIRVYSNP